MKSRINKAIHLTNQIHILKRSTSLKQHSSTNTFRKRSLRARPWFKTLKSKTKRRKKPATMIKDLTRRTVVEAIKEVVVEDKDLIITKMRRNTSLNNTMRNPRDHMKVTTKKDNSSRSTRKSLSSKKNQSKPLLRSKMNSLRSHSSKRSLKLSKPRKRRRRLVSYSKIGLQLLISHDE